MTLGARQKDAFLLMTLKLFIVDYHRCRIVGDLLGSKKERGKWVAHDLHMQGTHIEWILGQYTEHGLKMDESISVSSVIDKFHLRIEESLRAQKSDKGKGNKVGGPSVNMTEEGVPTRNQSWNVKSVARLVTSKGIAVVVDAVAWWIDSGVTTHVCKDRCWFKTYDPVKDKYVLYMGDDHFAPVHGKGSMTLEFSSGKTITLFNVLYVPKLLKNLVSGPILNKCGYKRVYESDKYILSKSGVFVGFRYYNNGIFMLNLNKVPDDSDSVYMFCCVYLLHAKDEALDKFRIYKTEVELQQNDLIKTLRTDRGGEYYDHVFFQSIGIIHETTTPYTPQQNGVTERKNRALKKMVNSMLSYSGLSDGLWGESMLTAYYLLNKVLNKRNKTTPYELWYKKRPNLSYLRVWGCRAVVRLSDPKKKTLGVKGIDCMFVGYAQHSKAYRFYVFEPNDSVSINSIIESRDAIFDENYFSSIPRPKDIIPNSVESQRDDHSILMMDQEIKLDSNILLAIRECHGDEGTDLTDMHKPTATLSNGDIPNNSETTSPNQNGGDELDLGDLWYSQNSKAYVVLNKHTIKVKESLNVTFDESPPPTKLSPLVDDDVGEEEAIKKNTKVVNNNNEEDESIEVDEIINIKESKNHPLDQVIGNLNQRTLRSQAQNHSNFFCFISTIEPKDVKEALKDESWVVAMQEELNQFVANDV
ncbi:zinc finger, CCHC-type containing protein [Tanacetum coccineum]